MSTFSRDVRHGLRSTVRAPGPMLLAVVALGLGIGATTAVFSALDALVLRAYGLPDPHRVVQIWDRYPSIDPGREVQVSVPNYEDYRAEQKVFDRIAAFQPGSGFQRRGESLETVALLSAGSDLLSILGARPVLGRAFGPDEDDPGTAPVALISHGMWQRDFSGSPDVLGRTMELLTWSQSERGYVSSAFEIVGVLPSDFQMPPLRIAHDYRTLPEPDVLIPLGLWEWGVGNRGQYAFRVLARLRPDATVEAARAHLGGIAAGIAASYPETNEGYSAVVMPLPGLAREAHGRRLLLLWAAAGLVLLIACANVAGLLIGRGVSRRRELAVRSAMGATLGRLVRQLLTESLLLAAAGGAVGLLVAYLGLALLRPLVPGAVPNLGAMDVDAAVLGFTIAASLITVMVFGLAPALRAARVDVSATLKDGTHGGTAGRIHALRVLIVGQVAVAFVLLASGGLLLRSLANMMASDPGFEAEDRVVFQLRMPPRNLSKYGDRESQDQLHDRIKAALEAQPGVRSAASTYYPPLSGRDHGADFTLGDRPKPKPEERRSAEWIWASADYFPTMGIPVLEGRGLTEADFTALTAAWQERGDGDPPPGQPVVINERMARLYWPGESALGKTMYWGLQDPATVAGGSYETGEWDPRYPSPAPLTIVGVVGDVNQRGLGEEEALQYYTPGKRLDWFVAWTRGDLRDVAPALRAAIEGVDPEIEVREVVPMTDRVERATATSRFQLLLISLFAGLATLMAAVGLFGVMAHSVRQRMFEIGVRMSLGATAADIGRLVLTQGATLVLLGLALGAAGAAASAGLLRSLLFGVDPLDPAVLAAAGALLGVIALAACLGPVRRASRADPVATLRYE